MYFIRLVPKYFIFGGGAKTHPNKLVCAIATSWSYLFPQSVPKSSNSVPTSRDDNDGRKSSNSVPTSRDDDDGVRSTQVSRTISWQNNPSRPYAVGTQDLKHLHVSLVWCCSVVYYTLYLLWFPCVSVVASPSSSDSKRVNPHHWNLLLRYNMLSCLGKEVSLGPLLGRCWTL